VSRALVMLAALALRVASLMIIIDSSTQKKPEKKTAKFAKIGPKSHFLVGLSNTN
jgi:hypothetical protein